MFIIKIKVPTHYQFHSLIEFDLGFKEHPDGSFSTEKLFQTKEDAINYLLERASLLSDSPEQYNKWEEEILKYDQMTNDAAVAHIEELDDKESEL